MTYALTYKQHFTVTVSGVGAVICFVCKLLMYKVPKKRKYSSTAQVLQNCTVLKYSI